MTTSTISVGQIEEMSRIHPDAKVRAAMRAAFARIAQIAAEKGVLMTRIKEMSEQRERDVAEINRLHDRLAATDEIVTATIGVDACQALVNEYAAVVPLGATAENGMKAELCGKFYEEYEVYVGGSGWEETLNVLVTWTTIEAIISRFIEKSRLDKPTETRAS